MKRTDFMRMPVFDGFEVARVNAQELFNFSLEYDAKTKKIEKLEHELDLKDKEIARLKQQLCIDGNSPFIRLYA